MIAMPSLTAFAGGVFYFVVLCPSWVLAGSSVKVESHSSMEYGWKSGFGMAAASSSTARREHSSEVKRLIVAATEKGERELVLTWDEAALGGSSGSKKFEALFKQMYSIDARINFTPGPTMPQMTAKVTQEVAAGQKSTTDVFIGSVGHFASLINRSVLEEYDYSRLSRRIGKKMVAPRNIGVEIYTTTSGVVYNTNLVSANEVPRKLESVLNPKWKGRIASTPYAAYFNRVSLRPEWGEERMKAFITKLSDQVGGLIRVNEVSRISSGEFVMLVMASGQEVFIEKAKGAPVDFIIPDDAATTGFIHLGVPRTAAHPNLSKLFINMVGSEEGQKLLYQIHATDHHELPGSQSADKLKALKARGIDILRGDIQSSLDHPEAEGRLVEELVKILSRKLETTR